MCLEAYAQFHTAKFFCGCTHFSEFGHTLILKPCVRQSKNRVHETLQRFNYDQTGHVRPAGKKCNMPKISNISIHSENNCLFQSLCVMRVNLLEVPSRDVLNHGIIKGSQIY